MLKKLGITQRVEVVSSYGERRDCLDQRWARVAAALGFVAVPLPNLDPAQTRELIRALALDAVLLSGGNTIAAADAAAVDVAPERDAFEHALVTEAMALAIPVFGVCRGLQFLNIFFGGSLEPCKDHAGTRHTVDCDSNLSDFSAREVNSFHDWCIPRAQLGNDLTIFAEDIAGNVEAFSHKTEKVAGIMWHPEREPELDRHDHQLLTRYLI